MFQVYWVEIMKFISNWDLQAYQSQLTEQIYAYWRGWTE